MMFSGTPASVAMVRPPMRQQTPVKAEVSTLIMRRAETTMDETRAGVGSGSGCRTQVLSGRGSVLGTAACIWGSGGHGGRRPGTPGRGGCRRGP
jgi:hypothetical protein